jgi:Tol biopolymer transport system component
VLELASGERGQIGRHVADPRWSPDGRHIAFLAPSGGRRGARVASADGTGWTQRFRTEGDIAGLHWLSWQP